MLNYRRNKQWGLHNRHHVGFPLPELTLLYSNTINTLALQGNAAWYYYPAQVAT